MPARQTWRMKMTYTAHLFKALTRQHHKEMWAVLKKHIPDDGVVFDVGAHAGQFTKLFARMVPGGHVYSFEPGHYALSIVRKVIRAHRLKNVSLSPIGLGDKETTESFFVPVKASGGLGFGLGHLGDDKKVDARETMKETIHLTTLDRFVAEHGVSRVDFIKADIEGWELRMLSGAEETLKKHRPALLLELSDKMLRRAGNSAEEAYLFLKSHGYDMFRCSGKGELSPAAEPFSEGDILCVPKKQAV